MKKFFQEDVR